MVSQTLTGVLLQTGALCGLTWSCRTELRCDYYARYDHWNDAPRSFVAAPAPPPSSSGRVIAVPAAIAALRLIDNVAQPGRPRLDLLGRHSPARGCSRSCSASRTPRST